MPNILLVEDSIESYQLIHRALSPRFQIEWAKSLAEATDALSRRLFDLILLDVVLPDGEGYGLCSVLQANDRLQNIPLIFLTARNSVSDRVLGFSVGGDDFIAKPFDAMELRARVEARLRKREREKTQSDILRIGDLEMNRTSQKAFITEGSQQTELDLTRMEFKLLLLFATSPMKELSRDHILDHAWGESVNVYSRSVDTHVSKLRRKLLHMGSCIESVHGKGYRFHIEEPRLESPKMGSDALPMSRG